jgi:3-phenylpropionate/trans-cinnamate dioxygenase ferredoxin subunit
MDPLLQWTKIAETVEELVFTENNIAIASPNGKNICVARFNDNYFGFAYLCPHAAAIMADGYIDTKGNAVCPLHQYKFSVQNGRNVSGEGYFMKTFPIDIRADGVWVGMK